MNPFLKLKVGLLRKAASFPEYMPILVSELASQYEIDERFIREKLVQFHYEKLIALSAWDDAGRDRPFDEWSSVEHFFNYGSDGHRKRVRLLAGGAEWLADHKDLESPIPTVLQPESPPTEDSFAMGKAADWEELRVLGEGGQSTVFLVRTPKRVAERVKNLDEIQIALHQIGHHNPQLANAIWSFARPDEPSELGAMKRFKIRDGGAPAAKRLQREIAILREGRPGLPQLLDANEEEQWMVTEYFPNKTLADFPQKYAGQPVQAMKAFRTLVETVADSLHKDGIVHRDIKLANVFIGDNGKLVPGDFGIVFLPDEHSRPTVLNERVGPWECMPQWADTGIRLEDVRPNFDVYMLGKLLWCMISGRQRLVREYHRQPPHNLEKLFPDDRHMRLVNLVLDRCLVERPQDCLGSAADLLPIVDQTLATMESGRPIRDFKGEIIIPCRTCAGGFYKGNPEGLSVALQQVTAMGVSAGPINLGIYVCDACGDRVFLEKASLIKLSAPTTKQ